MANSNSVLVAADGGGAVRVGLDRQALDPDLQHLLLRQDADSGAHVLRDATFHAQLGDVLAESDGGGLQGIAGAGDVPEPALTEFAQSAAASFLVASSGSDRVGAVFRLHHQALREALLRTRSQTAAPAHDEYALTYAFLWIGRATGWENAPAYLLRSLPQHAARAGLIDDLLTDDIYLLHANLRRMLQAADQSMSPAARDRARLLGHTLEAAVAGPVDRTAMFSVTEALDGIGTTYREIPQPQVPYRAQWALAEPSYEDLALRGFGDSVGAVCAVQVGARTLLAAGSGPDDPTVRLWDPVDGSLIRVLKGHRDAVGAVCVVQAGDHALLAIGSNDGTQLWDPADGSLVRVLAVSEGRQPWVNAMCVMHEEGRSLLVVASDDRAVRLWDPVDGSLVRVLEGVQDTMAAVCVQAVDRALLAIGSRDETVRLRDLVDGSQVRVLKGHTSWVEAVCTVRVGDRTLLATGSHDQTVRVWDLRSSPPRTTGQARRSLPGGVGAVCTVRAGQRTLLATAGGYDDPIVRLWDPTDGSLVRILERCQRTMGAVCEVQAGDRTFLAAGGDDGTVRVWDPTDGSQIRSLESHEGAVSDVCAVQAEGRTLIAAAGDGDDPRILLWDLMDGSLVHVLESQDDLGGTLCAVQVGDRDLLAVSGSGATVWLFDPVDGSQVHVLRGHGDWVSALCAVQVGDRPFLATGSHDQTVRLWDPADGQHVLTMPVHHAVWAMAPVAGSLAVGLRAGILVIKFEAQVGA